ncbi:hypothetical protein ISCGN_010509 [Ixodes scapularis]
MCEPEGGPPARIFERAHSIVDDLLDEINDTLNPARRCSVDSDVCTDCSLVSVFADDVRGTATSARGDLRMFSRSQLALKSAAELRRQLFLLADSVQRLNSTLLTLLRQRDRLLTRRGHHYDLITAVLQAVSPKRLLVPALLRGPALGSDAGHRARVLGRTPCGPVPEPQLRPIHAPQRSRCSPFPVARVEVRSS